MEEEYINIRLAHRLRKYVLKGIVRLHRNSLEDFSTTTSSSGLVLIDVEIRKVLDTNLKLDRYHEIIRLSVNSTLQLKIDLTDEYIAQARTQLLLGIQPKITLQVVLQHGKPYTINL